MRPTPKFPYLEHDGILAFAHRGGNLQAPENTMAAFSDAARQGYRFLETDVHASRDGVVFAFHDDTLLRMTGEDIAINALDAADIDSITVAGGHAIPRMEDLLEAFPECRFNIDAKAWPVVEPLGQLIRRTEVDDRICIGAFNDERIFKVCQLVGRPCVSQYRGTRIFALSFGRVVGVERLFYRRMRAIPRQPKGCFYGYAGFSGACP